MCKKKINIRLRSPLVNHCPNNSMARSSAWGDVNDLGWHRDCAPKRQLSVTHWHCAPRQLGSPSLSQPPHYHQMVTVWWPHVSCDDIVHSSSDGRNSRDVNKAPQFCIMEAWTATKVLGYLYSLDTSHTSKEYFTLLNVILSYAYLTPRIFLTKHEDNYLHDFFVEQKWGVEFVLKRTVAWYYKC